MVSLAEFTCSWVMELRGGGPGEANGRETSTSLMADAGGDRGLEKGDCARVAEFGALDMNVRSGRSEFG